MLIRRHWVWELYFVLISLIVLREAVAFFHMESRIHLYFYILYHFNPIFYFQYGINIAQIGMNIFQLLPLVLFIYGIPTKHLKTLQILFWIKIALDLLGNSYEKIQIKAIFYSDPLSALLVVMAAIAIYIPSYMAWYWYAFKLAPNPRSL